MCVYEAAATSESRLLVNPLGYNGRAFESDKRGGTGGGSAVAVGVCGRERTWTAD